MDTLFDLEISYTKSEQRIMNYILQHTSAVCLMSITQLADTLHTSESTISRFCRHCGYEDFKTLKRILSETLSTLSPAAKLASTLTSSETDIISETFRKELLNLEQTHKALNQEQILNAVNLLLEADHIYIHAKGASQALASLLYFRLNRFFKNITLLASGGSELFESLVHVTPDDVIITFGFQKLPVEGQVIIDHARRIDCKTILFTGQPYTQPEFRADINLYVYRGEPEEYHSMTSAVAMIELLIIVLASSSRLNGIDQLNTLHALKEHYKDSIPR